MTLKMNRVRYYDHSLMIYISLILSCGPVIVPETCAIYPGAVLKHFFISKYSGFYLLPARHQPLRTVDMWSPALNQSILVLATLDELASSSRVGRLDEKRFYSECMIDQDFEGNRANNSIRRLGRSANCEPAAGFREFCIQRRCEI